LSQDRYDFGQSVLGRRVIWMGAVVLAAGPQRAAGVEVTFVEDGGDERRGTLRQMCYVRFESVRPVRAFPSFAGQRSYSGGWWCATTETHVGFESWLERDHVMLLDFDPLVVGLSSQPFWLSWPAGSRRRRHAPDFFARLADGSGVVVDVRPDERIAPEDTEVFAVTAEACESVGWQYRRVGAVDPVLVANVRWLAAYRHRRCLNLAHANALDEVFAVSRPLADGVAAVGDRLVVLPTLFHLLWTGVLRADLRTSPLGGATIIATARGAW